MKNTKKNICFVEDLSNVKSLLKHLKNNPKLEIFTLNYTTHKLLEKNCIEHKIGEECLTSKDKKIINQMSIDSTINWWKIEKIRKSLTDNNIIIPEFIEMELLQYFVTIYKSARTILRIIRDTTPGEVICFTNINPFVKLICDEMNLGFKEYSNGQTLSLHYDRINIKYNFGPIPFSITTSRDNYKRIKGLTEKISQKSFRLNPKEKQSDDDGILLLEFNPATYESLINELGKTGKNIFLLNQRRPAIFNKKSLEIIRKSNCKIINLESFEKEIKCQILEKTKSFSEILEELWNDDSLFEELFTVESYSLWYSIKPVFTKMCSQRFLESIKRILLLEQFFRKFNISRVLEWAETGQEEREVLAVAKRHRIKTMMLQHSMFPIGKIWEPFSRFLANFSHEHISDYQAVWGNMTYEYAISNNHDKEKLFITGSPRHDSFFSSDRNHNQVKKILLATTGPPAIFAEDSTTDVFLRHEEFVKEIFRVIKKNHPEKELIVKPHPQSDFMNNAISFIKETDSNVKIVLEGDLSELINDCDLVISFNTSTILLESIIMEKPTITMITEEWAKENEIIKMDGVSCVNDIKDIESGISKIILDEKYIANRRRNSKQFLDKYLANHGMGSKQLVDALEKI